MLALYLDVFGPRAKNKDFYIHFFFYFLLFFCIRLLICLQFLNAVTCTNVFTNNSFGQIDGMLVDFLVDASVFSHSFLFESLFLPLAP